MSKDIRCAIGIDVDAVAGWLGSYGGQDSPSDIQRGMFAGEVGVPRLLKFLERAGIRASWFIPGHSLETFPDQVRMVVDGGHEIGAHGYSHENPIDSGRPQVLLMLERLTEYISGHTGVTWQTMEEIAEDFKRRDPFGQAAA